MKSRRFEPRRPLRNEIYSLMAVLVVPFAIGLVFPYESFNYTPASTDDPAASSCAFVYLTADEENSALTASRTAWKVNIDGTRGLHADLSVSELPEDDARDVMDISERRTFPPAALVRLPYTPLPPTLAAGKAERLAPEPTTDDGVAFPRSELLKID